MFGGVKIKVKPPRGCCLCIPATHLTKKTSRQGLIEAIKFLFMLIKKRDINPIGPLVIDYIKEHVSSLYEYLLKKKPNEKLVAKDITDDVDKHFRAGFVLHWDDRLNH